jgi:hypothetical protein
LCQNNTTHGKLQKQPKKPLGTPQTMTKPSIYLTALFGLLVRSHGVAAFGLQNSQPSSNADVSRRNFLQSAGAAAASSAVLFPQSSQAIDVGGKIRYGDESIMSPKEHGTSAKPVQSELLYGVSNKLADKVRAIALSP